MVAVGKVFAAVDVLAADDRVKLSRLLGGRTGRLCLLPGEISRLPLPRQPADRLAMLTLLDRAVRRQIDHGLTTWTLERIVPGIGRLPGGVDTAPGASNRLVALAHAHDRAAWASLAGCRISEIRHWRGAGASLTGRLVLLAVAAALDRHPCGKDPSAQGALFVSEQAVPVAVALQRVLAAVHDDRARAIFEHVDLRLHAPLSPVDAADLLGLGYERTRQLRAAARHQVAVACAESCTVRPIAADLAGRLGEAVTRQGMHEALMSMGLGPPDEPAGMLAVWLAGPYQRVPTHSGWFSPRPAELLADTRRLLAEAGGVHDRAVLLGDLVGVGVASPWAEAWLTAQPVRIEHDVVVHQTGRPDAMAERVLEATGRAMTADELQEWMPDRVPVGALAVELRRSRRFVETAPGRWELTDWGGVPSDHLVRLQVDVTDAVLAGEKGEVPGGLAALLGLRPGSSQVFATRFGPFALTYDGHNIARGSTRPVALACGATIGTTLVFTIDPRGGTATVEVLAPAPCALASASA